jgi:putative endonuclease
MTAEKSWYVYIVKCSNGSYYTGITTDIPRRIKEHNSGRGGSYTRSFGPVKLLWNETHPSRSSALKREAKINSYSRARKEEIL